MEDGMTEKESQVIELVKKFVEKYKITSPETIYQADRVWEHAPDLVKDLCDIVGYQQIHEYD